MLTRARQKKREREEKCEAFTRSPVRSNRFAISARDTILDTVDEPGARKSTIYHQLSSVSLVIVRSCSIEAVASAMLIDKHVRHARARASIIKSFHVSAATRLGSIAVI